MKLALVRVLYTIVVCVALGLLSRVAFAQHTGHTLAVGLRSVGGRYYWGGRYYGSYVGWRRGYYGWWGYPRYGYGWRFGVGWVPYWSASRFYSYPYYYAYWYRPAWVAPCAPYDRNYLPNPPRCAGPKTQNSDNIPSRPSLVPKPEISPSMSSSRLTKLASFTTVPRSNGLIAQVDGFGRATSSRGPLPRREVQNVIQALLAMPPDARRRQIDSGRYSNFSQKEVDLLRKASQLPLVYTAAE